MGAVNALGLVWRWGDVTKVELAHSEGLVVPSRADWTRGSPRTSLALMHDHLLLLMAWRCKRLSQRPWHGLAVVACISANSTQHFC
jgi:hypothetical protein